MLTAFKDEKGFQILNISANEFQPEDKSVADYCDALRIRAAAKSQHPDFIWRIVGEGPYHIAGTRKPPAKKCRPNS